jgi:hypothetical protein
MDPLFTEKLIKGKIAEAIFEQMFREQKEFEVIKNGFEYKTPELARNLLSLEHKEYFKRLRHIPDFILFSLDKKQAYLVEVKFRSNIDDHLTELIDEAKDLHNAYGPCYLFVATHNTFYYEACKDIVDHNAINEELPEYLIPKSLQQKYLDILNKFI